VETLVRHGIQRFHLQFNRTAVKLSDSLALADVMGTLDERLSLSTVNALFEAGSAQPVSSLEKVLDALRKTLLNQTDATQIGDAENSALSRVDFHAKLAALRLFANTKTNAFQIVSLTAFTAADLQTAASNPDALATRYALKELNPFAILGGIFVVTGAISHARKHGKSVGRWGGGERDDAACRSRRGRSAAEDGQRPRQRAHRWLLRRRERRHELAGGDGGRDAAGNGGLRCHGGQAPQSVAAAYAKYRDSVRGAVSTYLQGQGYRMAADGLGSYCAGWCSQPVGRVGISRCWRDGERGLRAANDVEWRRAA
jgi:hypothetical protein